MIINEMLVDENNSLVEAMNLLDKVAKKVLFITNQNKLVASVTDGDIRRGILVNGNLEAKVKDVANYNPKFLYDTEKIKIKSYMKKYSIEALPILDRDNNIVDIILWNKENLSIKTNKINIPVVVMAGGFGTRLYPYTKILPKPLIPIGDIPIVEHIMNKFYNIGCDNFYLIVNHKKNMIKAYFNEVEKSYNVHYIEEIKPLGTGGGLSLLKNKINGTFILTNCDILIDEDFSKIYKFHKENKNLITMVCSLKNFRIPYGVIEIGKDGSIEKMQEKPTMSFFTNTGCYLVEPQVIEDMKKNENVGFPDVVKKYKDMNKKIGVYPISENLWSDMGQFDEMEKMKQRLNVNE